LRDIELVGTVDQVTAHASEQQHNSWSDDDCKQSRPLSAWLFDHPYVSHRAVRNVALPKRTRKPTKAA